VFCNILDEIKMHCQWRNAVRLTSVFVSPGSVFWRSRILSVKRAVRWYTMQPPDWLGGKNILIKSGKWDFPEHAQTFDEKMKSKYFLLVIFLCFLLIKPWLCILFHIGVWLVYSTGIIVLD